MAEIKGPTPLSSSLDLFGEDAQVVLTLTFRTEAEADEVFESMAAAINANRLVITIPRPPAANESDGGAE